MKTSFASRRARMPWIALLLALLSTSAGHAQQPLSPATPALPDSGSTPGLQLGPSGSRLPGIDPRQCGTSQWAALCPSGRWTFFSRMSVTARITGFEGHYTVEQAQSGEVHVTYRETVASAQRGGEAIIVSEDAFAYRSREKFNEQHDLLDQIMASPIRISQLAAVLLDQSVRSAPAEVAKLIGVSAASTRQFIRTETPYTTTLYGAPWRVSGTVRAASPLHIAFDLHLVYRPVDTRGKTQERSGTIDLVGTVVYAERPKTLNDTIDLVGWKLFKGEQALPAVSTLREARDAVGVP